MNGVCCMGLKVVTRLRAVCALLLAALIWLPAASATRQGTSETALTEPITVMTRNLFLGTNLSPVIDAAARARIRASPPRSPSWRSPCTRPGPRSTRPTSRLEPRLFADEIAEHEPDLVGLQEVAVWRSGPLEPRAVGVRNAELVDYDFGQMLLDELEERGLDYEQVVRSVEADLESPSAGPDGESPRDVRVTLHDVILVRAGNDLQVFRRGTGHFRAQRHLVVASAGHDFTRGFGWVDVRRGAQEVRFINTHLEVGDSRIGHAQALELVTGPGSASVPVVIVCDCNSDPRRPLRSLPYRALTAAGYVDQWLTLRHGGPGHTCCVPNTLRDSDPAALDHRVDFVFARATRLVRAQNGSVLGRPFGDDPDRGESLRPSDHAGIVMRLRSVPR